MSGYMFGTLLLCIWGAAIVAILFCIFMLRRNAWVFAQRMKMIDEDWPSYKRLASYDDMMRRFWVWDVRRFLDDAQ